MTKSNPPAGQPPRKKRKLEVVKVKLGLAKPKANPKSIKPKKRRNRIGNTAEADDLYALSLAEPEADYGARVPDSMPLPTTTCHLESERLITANASGWAAFQVSPFPKSHWAIATVTGNDGGNVWTASDHGQYTEVATNFGRLRPVSLGIRVFSTSTSDLNLTGNMRLGRIVGEGDSAALPTAAGSLQTLQALNCMGVEALSSLVESEGGRIAWMPSFNAANSFADVATAPGSTFGATYYGALLCVISGPASATYTVRSYLNLEVLPYPDVGFLFPLKSVMSSIADLPSILAKASKWMLESGTNIADFKKAITAAHAAVSSVSKGAGLLSLISTVGGALLGATHQQRVVQLLMEQGQLLDIIKDFNSKRSVNWSRLDFSSPEPVRITSDEASQDAQSVHSYVTLRSLGATPKPR